MSNVSFNNLTHRHTPVTDAERTCDFDYYQNNFNVTHYVANNLPLPMSERFFPVVAAPRLISALGRSVSQ